MSEASPAPAPAPEVTRAKPRRPWRENLEAFGVAILMAVLLKPMVIEAYQIPTPSMQPTLMGSQVAGVHDRILVDKLRYEIFEPKRWDIVVFRYPIRRNQNYVKRVVGVPGDRLRITGGNLYQVGDDNEVAGIAAKPSHVQDGLWKQIYPARRLLDDSTKILDEWFSSQAGRWKADGDDLVGTPSSSGKVRIGYSDRGHRGISNQIYDGYPTDVARAIRESTTRDATNPLEGVQDVRVEFELQPTAAVDGMKIELRLSPPGQPAQRLVYRVEGNQGELAVLHGETTATGLTFPVTLPGAGDTARLGFAHVDDMLMALVDGEPVTMLGVDDHRVVRTLDPQQVALSIEVQSKGDVRLADVTIDRDLHYVPTGLDECLDELVPEGVERALVNHVIEVPEGMYFMMGDNTLASADSRQWQVITVAATDDGMMVNPKTHPDARVLKGNRRPWPLTVKPDPDENPVIVRGEPWDDVVFTDDNGEVFALHGKLSSGARERLRFTDPGSNGDTLWSPDIENVFFVPREHILGRPLATFWPLSRIGLIR